MINFDDYDIKIKYFSIHCAAVNPITKDPFVVQYDMWWDDTKPYDERMKDWDALPAVIQSWLENHRNQTLIVHDISPRGIRYKVLNTA